MQGIRPPISSQPPEMAKKSMHKVTELLDMIDTYDNKQDASYHKVGNDNSWRRNTLSQADWRHNNNQYEQDSSYGHSYESRGRPQV